MGVDVKTLVPFGKGGVTRTWASRAAHSRARRIGTGVARFEWLEPKLSPFDPLACWTRLNGLFRVMRWIG